MRIQHRSRQFVKGFLEAIFPQLPAGTAIELRSFGADEIGPRRFATSVESLLNLATALSDRWDVYFGVGARKRRGDGSWKGTKLDVAYVRAFWADIDRHIGGVVTPTGFPAPSAVVNSGRHLHLYWLLAEPFVLTHAEDVTSFEAVNKGIARRLEADSAWSIDHVLRVPSTLNHKQGGPYPVELLSFRPEQRYTFNDFAEWHAPVDELPRFDLASARTSVASSFDISNPPIQLVGNDARWWSGEQVVFRTGALPSIERTASGFRFTPGVVDQSRTLFAIGCALARAGASREAIATALFAIDRHRGYNKYVQRPAEYVRIALVAHRNVQS